MQTTEIQQSRTTTSVFEALKRAYEDEGLQPPEPPKEKSRWVRSRQNEIEWANGLFGSLRIQSRTCDVSRRMELSGSSTWAAIRVHDRPDEVNFIFDINPIDGVRVLHASQGEIKDVTDSQVPTFRVNIDWRQRPGQGDYVPHTRERDKDNVDLVFLREEDGMFIQLQISLTTRDGRFWLAVQEIYTGQIVRTNGQKAAKIPLTLHPTGSHYALIVPLYPESAHPASDYLRTFSRMGPKVIDYAISQGAVVPLHKCVAAEWDPQWPDLSRSIRRDGWVGGVVAWFNLVTGTGIVICEDQTSCFVHFKHILTDRGGSAWELGQFPILQPMSPVAVQYFTEGGKRKAESVRIL